MIEFSLHQDYVILGSVIILLIILVRILNHMANKEQQKKMVKTKTKIIPKVKEKTIFLEAKINQMLTSDIYITIKEYRKLSASAQGFKTLSDQRGKAIKDCHAFVAKLEKELGGIVDSKKVKELLGKIKETNKIKI